MRIAQLGQFEKHVFVCTSGDWCPTRDGDGLGVHARLKQLVKEAGLNERIRINNSGCFNQCGHGPMVVVYPEDVWYAGVTVADADEIFSQHLVGNQPVARLRYHAPPGSNKMKRDDEGRPIG